MNVRRSGLTGSVWCLLAGLASIALGATPPAPVQSIQEILAPAHLSGEVLIKFRPGTSAATIASHKQQLGAEVLARFRSGGERWLLSPGRSEGDAIAALRQDPAILYVEPNYTVSIDRTPNDPRYGELYGLHNTGQLGGTPGADIDAERAWDVSVGSPNVIVAVIDTGVDYNHADLAANIAMNAGEIAGNDVDDDGNGYVDDVRGWDFINHDNNPADDHSHGTHCSGTIAGIGDNGLGVAGVAWNVKILPLKFLGADGSGSIADAVIATEYATAYGVDVMSNSWGGGGYSQAMADAIQAAADAGILYVAAAGNSASDNDVFPNYPASYAMSNIVSVAATDRNDALASFSCFGATTVDLAAPGVDTLSTIPGNAYGLKSGTSMATPHVSGVAALIRSIAPGIDVVQLKARLFESVDPIPALSGLMVTGGRVNAFFAIADPDAIEPSAVDDLAVIAATSNTLGVSWTAPGDDGTIGTATAYDVRVSDQPIDDANFAAATPVAAPHPAPSGATETLEIGGLAPSGLYYVALKAKDEWGNTAAMSNVAFGTTLPPPTAAWSPDHLEADLLTGGSSTQVLVLENSGVGTLDWTVDDPANAGYPWLSVVPTSGRLAAGQSKQLAVTADATGLDGGDYQGWIIVLTNDPAQPYVSVPFHLHVTGAPDIAVTGAEIVLTSALSYTTDGGTTTHSLPVTLPPGGSGSLELTADGDFGDLPETATAILEGRTLGSIGHTGVDCSAVGATFPIGAAEMAALVADGHVDVQVTNTPDVGVFCAANRHVVSLHYRGAAALAFGPLFIGATATRQIVVENIGTADLTISSITVDHPDLTVSASSLVIPAHGSSVVEVTFAPNAVETVAATVTVVSDDPDTPVATVPVTGSGVEPPIAGVAPDSFQVTLNEGESQTRALTVSNSGGSPLVFSIAPRVGAAAVRSPVAGILAGEFQSLSPSPVPLTCIAADDEAGFLYAQANAGNAFFRYDAAANHWDSLASCPLYSGNNGGAAILDGKVYTVYAMQSGMGIYDIATGAWSTATSPLPLTANIASDGSRYLYLVVSQTFVRYEPATGITQSLAPPPFSFQSWGGLVHASGRLYGHSGNGGTSFGVYDVATGTWSALPALPSTGAVLGAAIDPFSGDYYAMGGYSGNNLYHYDTALGSWSSETIPYFNINDSGLGWLSAPTPGILFAQGQDGTGFARFAPQSDVLSVEPASGTVAPGTSMQVDVHFGATTVPPGTYALSLRVLTNDPLRSQIDVPASVTIVGTPDIDVQGEAHLLESAQDYAGYQATTLHAFDLPGPVSGGATIQIHAEGDFGDSSETATATAEGTFVGSVGAVGYDCLPADGTFPVAPVEFARLAQDGVVHVSVQNSSAVDLFCSPNRHTVRLGWHEVGDHLDFGPVFIGGALTRPLVIINRGSQALHVGSIVSDQDSVVVSDASVDVPAHGSVTVAFTFTPEAVMVLQGTVTITSDDPDEGTIVLPLSGQGLVAPDVAVAPPSFEASLLSDDVVHRTLTITNTGGSDLTWTAAAIDAPGGRALLVRDVVPNATYANEAAMDAHGIAYDVVPASQLPSISLQGYRLVILAAGQPDSFYLALAAQKSRIDAYVAAGGRLEYHASTSVSAVGSYVLPGGVIASTSFAYYNYVQIPGHPLVAGVPATVYGSYASRVAFTGPPAGGQIVMFNDSTQPVLIEYAHGRGSVVASGQEIEAYFGTAGSVGPILENAIVRDWGRALTWLRVAPGSGTVPAGGHVDVDLTIDATDLLGGDYLAGVRVASNDPDEPELIPPVYLHVTGVPDITVAPSDLDFGQVFVGFPKTLEVTIRNDGTDTLHVGPITTDHPAFAPGMSSLDLGVGEEVQLDISFDPAGSGLFNGSLSIASDDPDEALIAVALTGTAVPAPDVNVSPAELHEALYEGQVVTRTITVENEGGSPLTWQAHTARSIVPVPFATTAISPAPPSVTTRSAPSGYRASSPSPRVASGSRALIVEDVYPWGALSNEQILTANAIQYDVADTAALATINLSAYDVVIVASDQTTPAYQRIAASMGRLNAFVTAGGVLEFHAAGWGWNGGDASLVTLPGGMRVNFQYASVNAVVTPGHPIMQGVTNPFTGTSASHAYFTALPAGAVVLATATGSVPSLVEYRLGGGWVVASGQTLEFGHANAQDSGLILRNMIPYDADRSPRWLGVSPQSGTIPAGGTAALTVTVDATDVFPGDYAATLTIQSNDPDEALTDVPITLHVIGTPDIQVTPDGLAYGTVFLGAERALVLHLVNTGTEALHVSSIAPGDPALTVDATSFTLAPQAALNVMVTWRPTAVGSLAATLTIASDDPDEATVSIPISGTGLVAPDVDLSPASFTESLFTGQDVTRTLRIDNRGGSALTWSAQTLGAGAPINARALIVQDYAPWGSNANQAILAAAGIPYDFIPSSVLAMTSLAPYRLIILPSEQPYWFYDNLSANASKLDAFVRSGGCLEYHASSYNGFAAAFVLPGGLATSFNASTTNFVRLPDHPFVTGVPTTVSGLYASHSWFGGLPANAAVVAVDDSEYPTLVEYRLGLGTVVASGQTLEHGYMGGSAIGTILTNMITRDWSRQASWLSISPASGSIPAGGTVQAAVTISADGLYGGDYDGVIELSSNDPDEGFLEVPVQLHVTGVADIEVDPATLDFGDLFIGLTATRELTITNDGTDVLHVDAITSDDPAFSVVPDSLSLAIGESATVTVTFAPAGEGAHDAVLTIASDDPDEALFTVPMTGRAARPPVLAVTPSSISVVLLPGESSHQTLTVANPGGLDLAWTLRAFRANTEPVSVPTPAPTGAPVPPGLIPADYRPTPSQPRITAGSRALLVQDLAPWGTTANEQILAMEGIPFSVVSTAALASIDLAPYEVVIIASDQATSGYQNIAAGIGRLASWVQAGGILEFHGAAWSWHLGDASLVTLPGGMRMQYGNSPIIRILDPAHPLVEGVPDLTNVADASLAYVTGVPPGADVITTDADGRPTLVEYEHGLGIVIVSGHTLEYYWQYGGIVGRLLSNMTRYAFTVGPEWLTATPASGVVPPGGSTAIDLVLDASALTPGNYLARIAISSNDPIHPGAGVPLSLHVQGVPDIAVDPPSLAFGEIFVERPSTRVLRVTNEGTDALDVPSITSADPAVTVDIPTLFLEPGESRDIHVTYLPTATGSIAATLTVVSGDPDEGSLIVPLTGLAVLPPHAHVDPLAVEATALAGQTVTRSLTIRNTGGSRLLWTLGAPGATADASSHPGPVPSSTVPPAGFVRQNSLPAVTGSAHVLIVQDNAPWGTSVTQQILESRGVAFDIADTTQLPSLTLSQYGLIIVSSDQTTPAYQRLAAAMPAIASYVSSGGVLEFHAAGWGWYAGDVSLVTLPGGVGILPRFANVTHVLLPDHPILAGLYEPIVSSIPSHTYFTNVPAGAERIAADDVYHPNVIAYDYGLGKVVSSGHALEISYIYGEPAATILINMTAWAADLGLSWLTPEAREGSVPAGTEASIALTFDATRIPPGDYQKVLAFDSNDPEQRQILVTATFHVLRMKADAGPDQLLECSGGGAALATLDGSGSGHAGGPGAITRYAWSESGQPLGEGAQIAASFPLGRHDVMLDIEDADGAADADGVTIEVVDSLAPAGDILSPASGACFGPAALPVVVTDSYADACSPALTRVYDPPGGTFSSHGDHTVTLTVSDAGGHTAEPSGSTFTIDTVPPVVTMLGHAVPITLSQIVPFASLYTSSDADGASGGVVHEVLAVDGCVVYDGNTYGDRDGVLSDEAGDSQAVLCDIGRACGRRQWTNPVVTVTATDCAGNQTTGTLAIFGVSVATGCSAPLNLTAAKQSGTANLGWNVLAGTTSYQVVRGSLGTLRSTGGSFQSATNACLASAAAAPPVPDPSVPASGQAYWYLVRDYTDGVKGSWDEQGTTGQKTSRDAGIAAAAVTCP